MTTTEAYELTLEKIEELKKEGIEVTMKPSKSRDKEAVEKYNKPDRVPPDKWFHVTFKVVDETQTMKVNKASNYLGMCGIVFDTGGWEGYRDWELDWSFQYTGKEDEEWREAKDEVEDLIKRGGKNI